MPRTNGLTYIGNHGNKVASIGESKRTLATRLVTIYKCLQLSANTCHCYQNNACTKIYSKLYLRSETVCEHVCNLWRTPYLLRSQAFAAHLDKYNQWLITTFSVIKGSGTSVQRISIDTIFKNKLDPQLGILTDNVLMTIMRLFFHIQYPQAPRPQAKMRICCDSKCNRSKMRAGVICPLTQDDSVNKERLKKILKINCAPGFHKKLVGNPSRNSRLPWKWTISENCACATFSRKPFQI